MTITEGSCVIGLMRLSSQLFKLKTSILQTDVSTQPHTVMTTERINTYWQFHPYKFLVTCYRPDIAMQNIIDRGQKTSKPFFWCNQPFKETPYKFCDLPFGSPWSRRGFSVPVKTGQGSGVPWFIVVRTHLSIADSIHRFVGFSSTPNVNEIHKRRPSTFSAAFW